MKKFVIGNGDEAVKKIVLLREKGKVHFFRNRMRNVAVKMESSITGKGKKCTFFVIGCVM